MSTASNEPTFVWAISGKTEHLAILIKEKGEKTLIKWSSNGETALVPTSSIIPNSKMGRRGGRRITSNNARPPTTNTSTGATVPSAAARPSNKKSGRRTRGSAAGASRGGAAGPSISASSSSSKPKAKNTGSKRRAASSIAAAPAAASTTTTTPNKLRRVDQTEEGPTKPLTRKAPPPKSSSSSSSNKKKGGWLTTNTLAMDMRKSSDDNTDDGGSYPPEEDEDIEFESEDDVAVKAAIKRYKKNKKPSILTKICPPSSGPTTTPTTGAGGSATISATKRKTTNNESNSDSEEESDGDDRWRKAVIKGWPGLVSALEAKKPRKDIQYKTILEGLRYKPVHHSNLMSKKLPPLFFNPKPSIQPEDLLFYVEAKDTNTKRNIGSWTINFKKIVSWCDGHDEEDEDNKNAIEFDIPTTNKKGILTPIFSQKKGTTTRSTPDWDNDVLFTIRCIRSDTGKSCYLAFEEKGDSGKKTIEVQTNQINKDSFASTKEGDVAKTLWWVRQEQKPGPRYRHERLDVTLHFQLEFLNPTKLPNGSYRFEEMIGCEFWEQTQTVSSLSWNPGTSDFDDDGDMEGRGGFGNKRRVDEILVYLEGLRWN